jgi:hypothetical protein
MTQQEYMLNVGTWNILLLLYRVLKKALKEEEITEGSEKNGVEKHRWGDQGWNQAVGPV